VRRSLKTAWPFSSPKPGRQPFRFLDQPAKDRAILQKLEGFKGNEAAFL